MRKADPLFTYLLIRAGAALFSATIFTVNMVYQVEMVGLNPLQLVLVGTTLELTAFLFEIPTGIVADVYSRRLSVIIGFGLMGLGFMLEGSLPLFAAVLAAQVIWGIGWTFTSGAVEAWISDEVGEERASDAFMRGAQAGQIASFVGIGLSVGLASWSLQAPIILGGFLYVMLALGLLLWMPETNFEPAASETTGNWSHMVETAREGAVLIRSSAPLRAILLVSLFYGLFSEGFDRLWTPHLLDSFTFPRIGSLEPIVWFGIIRVVGLILTIGAVELVRRRLRGSDRRMIPKVLAGLSAVISVAILTLALAGEFWLALVALWTTQVARSSTDPLYTIWINQNVTSRVRATVISSSGQLNALGQVAGGPFVGWLGTLFSVRLALAVSSFLLVPVLAVFRYALAVRAEE